MEMNVVSEKLKALGSTEVGKAFFARYANRKRVRNTTNINRLKVIFLTEGKPIEAVDTILKELETLQVGKIEAGEFKWEHNMRTISRIALDLPIATPKVVEPARKRRGRPVGSRNKPKRGRPFGSKNKPKESPAETFKGLPGLRLGLIFKGKPLDLDVSDLEAILKKIAKKAA